MPSASDIAVSTEDLRVSYRSRVEKRGTLRLLVSEGLKRRSMTTVQALRGVSLEVPRGSVLGVIGRNGAGKTTLLRAIAGIIPPSEGRIVVRGRVSTLLSLGVGFNRELTGRDNVILGGLAAGIEHDQLRRAFNDIVAFAEMEEFIDFPMRSYSSGMAGRLAFAVATHFDTDILLIDEALSTGDIAFKEKCLNKMRELCSRDRTVVLVSHGLESIKEFATHCLWLHKGEVVRRGEPDEVAEEYRRFLRVERGSMSTAG